MFNPKKNCIQVSSLIFVLLFMVGEFSAQRTNTAGMRPGVEPGIGEGLGYVYSLSGSILLNNRHNIGAGPCITLGTNPFKDAVGYGGLLEYNYFLMPFDKNGLNVHASANVQYRNNPVREISYRREFFTYGMGGGLNLRFSDHIYLKAGGYLHILIYEETPYYRNPHFIGRPQGYFWKLRGIWEPHSFPSFDFKLSASYYF